MGTAGLPPEAAPRNERASPHGTTLEQQAGIRLVFQSELGISHSHARLIGVESAVLYSALSARRHADVDAQDDGSLHSEVLKNAIGLLQRFHRCAPLYPKTDAGHRQRNNNFFAKDIFCRVFCGDIEGFDNKDNPRAWIDVFHFFQAMKRIWDGSLLGGLRVSSRDMVAASFSARGEFARAEARTRKGAVLWELMGLASKAIDRYGHTRPETWCVEAAVRIGMWRKRLKQDEGSLFRLPVEDDWGFHSEDVLPECDDGAMTLFKELETKLRAFYMKCVEQMPAQAAALPEITRKMPSKTPVGADNLEAEKRGDSHHQQDSGGMSQRDGTSEEVAGPHNTGRDFAHRKTVQQNPMPQHMHARNSIPPTAVLHMCSIQRASPQKKTYNQRALTRVAHEQATPQDIIISEDPRKLTAPRGPVTMTLEQAKELITNVLRANGQLPDWDPELPRMVVSASLRLGGPLRE